MRALTVVPLQAGSAAVTEMPDPEPGPGELLVQGLALGVCGTDREIMDGEYGWAPPGEERLILGQESLGRAASRRSTVTAPSAGPSKPTTRSSSIRRSSPSAC